MNAAERTKRVLLALADVGLRVEWLRERLLVWDPAHAALLLNELAEQNEAANPGARECMLTVAMVLAAAPPDDPMVDDLRREVARQRLWSLARPLRRAPVAVSLVPPAVAAPVPDYGTGREVTLGERRSLARRPDRALFDRLLKDPHPMVTRQLLVNPKLTEDDVIRLATIRPTRIEVLQEIVRSYRWMSRPRIRMALLQNPGAPGEIVIPFVVLCVRSELREIVRGTETSVVLRATAHELLERRPPSSAEGDSATLH